MDYKKLVKVVDADKFTTARGKEYESKWTPEMDRWQKAHNDLIEEAVGEFGGVYQDWCSWINSFDGATGASPVWEDSDFVIEFNEFVKQVELVKGVIDSKGSDKAMDALYSYWEDING